MLEEFDREMEHTDSRMKSLTTRVNKAIKKSGSTFYQYAIVGSKIYSSFFFFFAGKCQLITILVLVIILVIVIIFFFIPFK